jgi:integrase
VPRSRSQHAGSIYRRADGYWVASVSIGSYAARRRKVGYGRTRQEAQQALADALREQQHGVLIPGRSQTVGEFLTRWLEDTVRPGVRPLTFKSYSEITHQHLIPGIGRIRLTGLTPQHVQALVNEKARDGLSPRTVHYLRAVLRNALNKALRWSLVLRNVAELVDVPRIPRTERPTLDVNQARRFLAVTRDHNLEALYTVALALGLRQGEALGLKWEDIDFTARTLTVRRALQRIDGKLTFVEPKSVTSRRTVPLPSIAIDALGRHRGRQVEGRYRSGPPWRGLVFTSSVGTPLSARNIIRSFKGLLRAARLPRDIRFHDLRHSCASLLLAQGVSPRTIMETLGHSQVGLTLNTYAHVLPSLRRDAAEIMDRLLSTAES